MEFVTCELRPRLCACNAFISLNQNIDNGKVKIKITENSIVLLVDNTVTSLILPIVRIIPTSLSMLNISNKWIYFRVQIKPLDSTFGSFETEVVMNPNAQNRFFKDSMKEHYLPPRNENFVMLCSCCKNIISKTINLKRILPFPDIDYDISEWFCCKHNDINSTFSSVLQLQETDCCYGLFFLILHKNVLDYNTCISKEALFCNRCLLNLGKQHAKDTIKMWSCSVDYKILNDTLILKSATDPFLDFVNIIKESNTVSVHEEIVLESIVNKQRQILVLKPMDWQLSLLTEPKEINYTNIIHLQQKHVVKILYKYETSASTLSNSNIKYYEVPLSIIEAGIKSLLASSNRIPQLYRNTGDYHIGYITLD